MLNALPPTAAMSCPVCGRAVAPAPDSSWVMAWYTCLRCGRDWSARLRNGRPDMASAPDLLLPGPRHEERA